MAPEQQQQDERTPLLAANVKGNVSHNGNSNGNGAAKGDGAAGSSAASSASSVHDPPAASWFTRIFGPANTFKILLAGFIISFSFSFTQVPILYAFRRMVCDDFYRSHPPYTGVGDRCSRNDIDAGTAMQYSILGMSTTFCGTWNLFVTGWTVKRWGPRFALILQTSIPGIRVLTQIAGVLAGGRNGIIIFQSTQLITILGGPAGYILVINILVGELVEPLQRTAVFGKLQGCLMLGQAVGYLLGGMTGDTFGTRMPFQVAFFFFCISSLYAGFIIPYIDPDSMADAKGAAKRSGLSGFLAPLRVLAPQLIQLRSGRVRKHYGVLFLCMGVFLGVLATGYAPILIQMYATAAFQFDQANNGWLMSGNALMRGFFLIFIFPRIIAAGRNWWVKAPESAPDRDGTEEAVENDRSRRQSRDQDHNTLARIPSHASEFDAPMVIQSEQEPVRADSPDERDTTASHFDLFFLRWSLVVDGALTAGAAFATKDWHIYLAALLLPFGSGSAPAAKGVITEMCPSSQRSDALNAITLVENISRLATVGLFGFVFSALAEVGKAYLTFFCNAAIAVVGMGVLLFSHFPPPGAVMVETNEEDHEPPLNEQNEEEEEA